MLEAGYVVTVTLSATEGHDRINLDGAIRFKLLAIERPLCLIQYI